MSCLLPSCSTFYNNTENICISATALLQQTLNFKYGQVCVEQTFRWPSGAEHGPSGKLPAGNMGKHRNVRQSGLNQTFHWTHKANRDHWKCLTEPCLLILTNLFTLNIYCYSTFKYGLRSDVRPCVSAVTTRGRAVGHALKLGKCLLWRERQRDDKEPTQPVLHCWPVDWKNKKKWETDDVQTRAAPRRNRETQVVYKRPACLRKIVWLIDSGKNIYKRERKKGSNIKDEWRHQTPVQQTKAPKTENRLKILGKKGRKTE